MKKKSIWRDYYQATKNMEPAPLLVEGLEKVKRFGKALDFGCGAGRDTQLLLKKGFQVTAMDADAEAISFMKKRFRANRKLQIIHSSFQNFPFEETCLSSGRYDLINARHTLPFIENKKTFHSVFEKVKCSLNKRGVFVWTLFGVKDDFSKTHYRKGIKRMVLFRRSEVEKLFKGLKMIYFSEWMKYGKNAVGKMKFHHTFEMIGIKQ